MGFVPTPESLPTEGLRLSPGAMESLLRVDAADWTEDLRDQRAFFDHLGARLPKPLRGEQEAFARRLGA
jgi:GTP-dependent phosphoenolpyruvate carboxykinase